MKDIVKKNRPVMSHLKSKTWPHIPMHLYLVPFLAAMPDSRSVYSSKYVVDSLAFIETFGHQWLMLQIFFVTSKTTKISHLKSNKGF